MNEQYSPYVKAALASKPNLAPLRIVRSADRFIPPIQSQEARDLLYVDPFSELPETPPKPLALVAQPKPDLTFQEMHTLTRRWETDQEIARKANVEASAMWARQLSNTGPGAIEAALVRIDKLEERMRRHRAATGLSREALGRREKWVVISNWLPQSMIKRTEEAAASRGEKRSQTIRFLIECGLILFDERVRRYNVWVLQQMQAIAKQAVDNEPDIELKREAVAQVFAEIEIDRYVDVESVGFQKAKLDIDPLHGAPPAVRELLRASDAPRALSA
jgi:hypothetical protein